MKTPLGIRIAAWIAIIGSAIAILLWIVNFHGLPIAQKSQQWAEFGEYVGGTLTPILAFASFIGLWVSVQHEVGVRLDEESRADSAVYRENATKNLERAFLTFVGTAESSTPISDRLVWLTTARLILLAQSVSQKIKVHSVREMYEADEEFWRRRFYDVLQPTTIDSPLSDPNYFRQGEKRMPGYVIDERSIRVIYEFVEWPAGRSDPIVSVQRFSDQDLDRMILGRRGIKEYIESCRRASLDGSEGSASH